MTPIQYLALGFGVWAVTVLLLAALAGAAAPKVRR